MLRGDYEEADCMWYVVGCFRITQRGDAYISLASAEILLEPLALGNLDIVAEYIKMPFAWCWYCWDVTRETSGP